tara:strand:+ start:1188 stop:1973 length:786 start_codon:yes stop_codon:yes gene_type:complete
MNPPQEYLDWLTGNGMSDATVRRRGSFFVSRLDDWSTFDQRPAFIVTWLNQHSGWTRRTYAGHLHSIYAWMVETGKLEASPIAGLRTNRTPPPRPSPLSQAELSAVTLAASGHVHAWVLLGSLAGLRAHEIVKIRGEHVTEDSIYVNGKGGVEAYLPTHPAIWSLAGQYPRTGWWFPSHTPRGHLSTSCIGNKMRAHFRACGVRSGSVHRLRHTYGTNLVRSGVPLNVVRELMRHTSLATTQMYLGTNDEEKRAAVLGLVA